MVREIAILSALSFGLAFADRKATVVHLLGDPQPASFVENDLPTRKCPPSKKLKSYSSLAVVEADQYLEVNGEKWKIVHRLSGTTSATLTSRSQAGYQLTLYFRRDDGDLVLDRRKANGELICASAVRFRKQ